MLICKPCATTCDELGRCPACGAMVGFEDEPVSWEEIRRTQKRSEAPSTRSCPKCWKPMRETRYDGLVLDECGNCRGIWFDRGELAQALALLKDTSGDSVRNLGPDAKPSPGMAEMRCPACGATMIKRTIEGFDGVIVDHCDTCGMWLDYLELEMIFQIYTTRGISLRLAPVPWYSPLLQALK